MNVRFGRILMLLAVVSAAAPVRAGASDRGGPEFGAPRNYAPATPAEKAAEARRLSQQAAALNQRAAQLAAESRNHPSNAPSQKKVSVVTQTTPWTSRGAAEVMISDAESAPQQVAKVTPAQVGPAATAAPIATQAAAATQTAEVPGAVPSIGWRSHRTVPAGSIRFSDPSVPASTTSTSRPAALPIAAYAATSNDGVELKLTEAALANEAANQAAATAPIIKAVPAAAAPAIVYQQPVAQPQVPQQQIVQQVATAPAPAASPVATHVEALLVAPQTLTAETTTEPQVMQESAVHLASKIADSRVKTADSEEPIPPPNTPAYTDDRALANDGVPCDCVDGCCPPPRPLMWTSGIEATFLRPDLNSGYATFGVAEFNENRFDEFSTSTDDVDDFYMSPRLWFGVQGCLWGANVRYWHLRANEGSFDPTLGSDGNWDGPNCGTPDFGFNSCNDLEAYTVDLEVTRRFCCNDCWMQFSAGVRHAEIEQDSSLIATALADDSVLFGFASGHRQTRGTGLVLGWYGRKPIFPCSCVHWFYNFHWSALWGPTETAAETGVLASLTSLDPDAVAAAGSVNGASTAVDDNLFIGEIQLGLEWDYALRCMPANAFCRVALEYQRWTGGMGYSASNSFAGVEIDGDATTLGDALAIADAPELDLVGLAVSTGLTW